MEKNYWNTHISVRVKAFYEPNVAIFMF
jgi:hypothetical protein